MSLGTNNIGSPALAHEQDNDADIIYDFSTLREELDGESSVESDEGVAPVFEYEEEEALDFEFATGTEVLSSTTFEEEAFGVKRAGNAVKQGNGRQAQPTLWNKDPFAPDSSKDRKSLKGDNRLKKVPYRSNAPPPSNREISAGLSFASILSGKTSQDTDGIEKNEFTSTNTTLDETNTSTTDPPSSTVTATVPVSELGPAPTKTTILPQVESTRQPQPSINHHQPHPIMYNLADIEANMGQQQTSKQNLLYELLPGLAPQEHQPAANHTPVDINSFFPKQQSQPTNQTNSAPSGHQPSIHKPNLTAEQELKQNEEDNGKSSYDGLMTNQNVESIHRLEQSQLATSMQRSSGDFYYEMYQNHNKGGQPQQPFTHHPHQPPMNIGHLQDQSFGGGKNVGAKLDEILHDIRKNHSDEKAPEDGSALLENDAKTQLGTKNDRQHVSKTIESIYFLFFEVEQPSRQPSHYVNSQHSAQPMADTRQEAMDKIWNMLTVDQSPPSVISILSINKGMTLIARLLPYLNDNQRLVLMTTIAYYFGDLLPPLSNNGASLSQQQRQNVDYLHPSITGCIENTLLCASLSWVSHVLSSVSNHPDFKRLIFTMTGQRFVGSLLFHGQGKQQQQQTIPVTDIEHWQKCFDSLFSHTMTLSPLIKEKAHVDNVGLWMLLNSIAGCGNDEQKEQMVHDFREPLTAAMATLSDMTRNHPLPYLPFPIQTVYPVINELWTRLKLSDP